MDNTNYRFCKKCLTRDLIDKDDYFKTLQMLIENIPEDTKTGKEEYEGRLKECTECDRLMDGLCNACGCYVELRAAKRSNSCPYEKW